MSFKVAIKHVLGSVLSKSPKINNIILSATLPMSAALSRIKSRGIGINTIIDVGGSDGRWSLMAMRHYPDAFYFIIEANKIHEEALMRMAASVQNFDYVVSAAGDGSGDLFFDDSDPFGGRASKRQTGTDLIAVPATTIDYQVKKHDLKPPFGVKLDTHGFEVPILEGARATLKETHFLVIEAYNFNLLADECLRFHEVCFYMEKQGFRCIDIAEPMYRPKDNSFWQIDLFFIQSSRREFESSRYI